MDEVIFQEFKGTGNMEIVLSREIANMRIYPAINIGQTGTRKEALLLEPEELKKVYKIRQALAGMNEAEAARGFINQLKKFPTNEEFLASIP